MGYMDYLLALSLHAGSGLLVEGEEVSNKMREEFEEWFKYNYKWFIEKGSPQHGMERFDQELPGYAREIAHHDWRVWQASRESLSIELPYVHAYPASEAASDQDYYIDEAKADMRHQCRKAIESLGIKVNP